MEYDIVDGHNHTGLIAEVSKRIADGWMDATRCSIPLVGVIERNPPLPSNDANQSAINTMHRKLRL